MSRDNLFVIKNGNRVGRDPRTMTVEELAEAGHVKRPMLKIIREKCMDCCCGQSGEVAKCTVVDCPLWPLRMNVNTLREKTAGNAAHMNRIRPRKRAVAAIKDEREIAANGPSQH